MFLCEKGTTFKLFSQYKNISIGLPARVLFNLNISKHIEL